jgi:hypothetical protein
VSKRKVNQSNLINILVLIAIPILIAIAFVYFAGPDLLKEELQLTPPSTPKVITSSTQTEPSTTTVKPPQKTHPPIPSIFPPDTPSPTEPKIKPVDLTISMPEPSYDLCCGMIPTKIKVWGTPTIKNTGGMTAHNVKVDFELFSNDGGRIRLDGKDFLERNIGDLESEGSQRESVEFTISLLDAYKIQESGATAIFNISSDEKNIVIEEEFSVTIEG